MNELSELSFIETPLMDKIGFLQLLLRFLFELLGTNLLFVFSIWLCESNRYLRHVSCKLVQYDRIELIRPDKKDELLKDLQERTGLDIIRVEVGHIDFLRDSAILKLYYEPVSDEVNTIDTLIKIPREDE